MSLILTLAMLLGPVALIFGVRTMLTRRWRAKRHAAARAWREEQDRIWHELQARRTLERAD